MIRARTLSQLKIFTSLLESIKKSVEEGEDVEYVKSQRHYGSGVIQLAISLKIISSFEEIQSVTGLLNNAVNTKIEALKLREEDEQRDTFNKGGFGFSEDTPFDTPVPR
jgi:hypothetical protein